jgi:type I restriction enzyme M protein
MANSASDARASEAGIRRKLIEERSVDVMVAIGPNFFYTVTLPVTLWFLDRGKRSTPRADTVLFIDAQDTFRQLDRAHRDFRPAQIELLANVVRLYRGEEPETVAGSAQLMAQRFPGGTYVDVPGLCRIATIAEVEAQGWSLNPGRYVGNEAGEQDDGDFAEGLAALHTEFTTLSEAGETLRRKVDAVIAGILNA